MDTEIKVCSDIFCVFVINVFDIVSVFQNRHSRCVLLVGGSFGAFARNTLYEYLFFEKKQDKPELRRCFCDNFCGAFMYFDYTDGIVFPQRDLTGLLDVRYIRNFKKNNFNIW